MKQSYEIIILNRRGTEKFKGIFYKDNKKDKFYFRTFIDRSEYNKMFGELLYDGAVDIEKKIEQKDNEYSIIDYDIKHTNFKDITDLIKYLENSGFNVKYKVIDNSFSSLSIIVDGKNLNPEVISFKESEKIIFFAHILFQYSNNISYEPKYRVRASSFAVDIQEAFLDDNLIKTLIKNLKSNVINVKEYFNNKKYSKMIESLKELVNIKSIDTFKIVLNGKEEEISIQQIKDYIFRLNKAISELPVTFKIDTSKLRAFDDKNLRVLFDKDKVYSIHVKNKDIFDKLKKVKGSIKLNGFINV